jgi:hypothetical protein
MEFGAIVGAGLTRGAWGVEVELAYRRPWTGVETAEVELAYQSIELSALACGHLGPRWCLGLRAETLLAAAPDVAEPRLDVAVLPGVVGTVMVPIPLAARWRLLVGADVLVRLQRVRLEVAPYGEVLVLPSFGGSLRFGPEFVF